MLDRESITRRNLPHWYVPGSAHFVTYRLDGTIPREILNRWRNERELGKQQLSASAAARREGAMNVHKQFFAKYDRYLDQNRTRTWLANPAVATLIRENLHHHHGQKYYLIAYTIMPNHVHVLLQPRGESPSRGDDDLHSDEYRDGHSPLSEIMHSLKSCTAHRANKVLNRTGVFWQAESYDHWVRDDNELERIVAYIIRNPVQASLCQNPIIWPFGSAAERFQQDGNPCGVLWWPNL